MKRLYQLAGLALVVWMVTAPCVARTIPNPAQQPAPGNDFDKVSPRLSNYGPRTNYMLECAGCHQESGAGFPPHGVPNMAGFVGNFLRVKGGRDYLLQVPGITQSSLTNKQLAVLLNWMLFSPKGIAGSSTPKKAKHFTKAEVARLRHHWVDDLPALRRRMIQQMKHQGITIGDGMNPE